MKKTVLALAIGGLFGDDAFSAACGPVYGADGIAVDREGKVWMSHYEDVRLGRLDPASGEFAEFLPTTRGNPYAAKRDTWSKADGFDYGFDFGMMGIAIDEAHGLVWSARFNDNKLLRFSSADRQFTELAMPGLSSARFDIPMDSQGNVWLVSSTGLAKFTDGKAVKIAPDGKVETFALPWEKFTGGALTLDKEGNPWISAAPEGGNAELYAWNGKIFERRELPNVGSHISSLYFDVRGDLWFTATEKNAIGRWRKNKLDLFPIPTTHATPSVLTRDAAGNLWFTEWYGNKLGRITPDGQITEYPLPPEEETPLAVAADREGKVWFSVAFNYSLFRLDPDTGKMTEFPVPVPPNWSKDTARGVSFCTIRSKGLAKTKSVKAEQSSATEQMVHDAAIRHPKGYPKDRDAVLFEQKCQTACHTWYRVDKASARRSEWKPTVDRMIEANAAAIAPGERKRIVRYLNRYYALLK
ncbi:MAG: lyase [Methylococcaceae bacterium]|nr:lyase [Methylococcaceae bacterium]